MPDVHEIPVGDDPTNEERRIYAMAGVAAHYVVKNKQEPNDILDEDIVDLLTDLWHLADSLEIDFAACFRMAETNHEEERE